MTPETPPSFIVRVECEKAATDNGWRIEVDAADGWIGRDSAVARGRIHLGAAGPDGPWFLALDHPGVIAELGVAPVAMDGPGKARFSLATRADLHATLGRVWRLATSLPDAPLAAFERETRDLPRTTEVERLVVQRIGQDLFRRGLLAYWDGRCPMTGIADPDLLRASHIVAWAECADDAERLDVHNGLLLSALWDAAFDRALVGFDDDGRPLFAPTLSADARAALVWSRPLPLVDAHRPRLARHRARRSDWVV